MMGAFPAGPAGFVLGTAILIRDTRRRLISGALVGLAVGALWAVVWRGVGGITLGAIVLSGVAGGLLLTLLQTWIRRQWGWWTRWEA
jgi:ABC-type antimicrobial peptide transport system permease subunit